VVTISDRTNVPTGQAKNIMHSATLSIAEGITIELTHLPKYTH